MHITNQPIRISDDSTPLLTLTPAHPGTVRQGKVNMTMTYHTDVASPRVLGCPGRGSQLGDRLWR